MDKLMFKHFIMVNIYIIFSLTKLIVFSIYLASVFFFFFLWLACLYIDSLSSVIQGWYYFFLLKFKDSLN